MPKGVYDPLAGWRVKPPPGLRRWLFWRVVVAVLCVAQPVTAGVRVSFYSHPWGMSPTGYLYFPHAFIVIEPDGVSTSLSGPESYGFTAVNTATMLMTRHGPGEIIPEDQRYRAVSVFHFAVEISDEQYLKLRRGIEEWRSVPGDPYDLHKRNCITFIARMVELVGLKAGGATTLDPAVFLEQVRLANPSRIEARSPEPTVAVTNPTN
jgi:hypothetical protein